MRAFAAFAPLARSAPPGASSKCPDPRSTATGIGISGSGPLSMGFCGAVWQPQMVTRITINNARKASEFDIG